MTISPRCLLLLGLSLSLVGCQPPDRDDDPDPTSSQETSSTAGQLPPTATPLELDVPRGLPPVELPADNPLSAERVELGRRLFFDKNLSQDRTISCADCHDPNRGWSNGARVAAGVGGVLGTRNVPTLFNVAYNRFQFWDGRARSLEAQALGPILNPSEMALASHAELFRRVAADSEYVRLFREAFVDGITAENIARAIACFERTILTGNTPFDRFQAGDREALSPAAQRGRKIFFRREICSGCHSLPHFTDNMFYNIGVGFDAPDPDPGQFAVSKLPSTTGRFKTPTLREIAKTAPYMHDGSMQTLEEVVEYYDKGGNPNPYLDKAIFRLNLSAEEKADLVRFLVEGLSSQ